MGYGSFTRPRSLGCAGFTLALSLTACARSDYDKTVGPFGWDTGQGAASDAGSSGGDASANSGTAKSGEDDAGSDVDGTSAGSGGSTTGAHGGTTGGFMIPDVGGARGDAGAPALSSMAPKAAGDLVISEVMPDPEGGAEHEWVELYNPGTKAFDLQGCVLKELNYGMTHAIASLLFVPGSTYVVLARKDAATDGVITPYSYDRVALSSTSKGDGLSLECGAQVIDTMTYTTSERGVSLQLSSNALTATQNDVASAWCYGTGPIGLGQNKGTPSAPNNLCP